MKTAISTPEAARPELIDWTTAMVATTNRIRQANATSGSAANIAPIAEHTPTISCHGSVQNSTARSNRGLEDRNHPAAYVSSAAPSRVLIWSRSSICTSAVDTTIPCRPAAQAPAPPRSRT